MPVGIDDEHLIGSDAAFLLTIGDAERIEVIAELLQAVDQPGGVPSLRGGNRIRAGDGLCIRLDDVELDALVLSSHPVTRANVGPRQDFQSQNLGVKTPATPRRL